MKSIKVIIALALTMCFTGIASAQTKIRFTGSTAFRAAAHNAILHALGTTTETGTVLSSGSYGYVGSSLGGANQAIFVGTLSGTSVIIETGWSGSEGGIQTTAQDGVGLNVLFLSDTTSGLTAVGTSGLSAGTNAQIPDVTMADTLQSTSRFNSNASIVIGGTNRTYAALVGARSDVYPEGVVGVQPFVFAASNGGFIGTSGTIKNMTGQLARSLFQVSRVGNGGALPVSMFTALTSDSNSWVFPVGRDIDSGTRLNEFAEVGLGALRQVTQYQPLITISGSDVLVTATGTAITKIVLWPVETVNGIVQAKANGGYNSGGKLAGAVGSNTTAMTTPKGTGGILIGFFSTSDSPAAVSAGARELTYDGVPYSLTAVQEGLYTAWCYERMYYRAGSPIAPLADVIATQMHDVDSPVLLNTMKVSRSTDGGVVTHD